MPPAGEDHLDPELVEHGDTRNVVDRYRYWRLDAIVADLDTRRHPFHVAIENWQHDLNIGSIVRTANAFAAETVHIIGRRRWNKRGAMVTDRYQHLRHHETIGAFFDWADAEALGVIGIDILDGATPLDTYVDVTLAQFERVWAAAGHPRAVFPTHYDELLRITAGHPVEVT